MEPKARLRASSTRYGEIRERRSRISLRSIRATFIRLNDARFRWCMIVLSEPKVLSAAPQREVMYRHTVTVRLTHWINTLMFVLLLASGLRIFNYHSALYWGNDGHEGMLSFIAIEALTDVETGAPVGVTTVLGHSFNTTGVLGVSYGVGGEPVQAAFPNWLTLPAGLGPARGVHFDAAWLLVLNGFVYLLSGLFSGHFRRDLLPAAKELSPRNVLADIWNHVRLRRARGPAARHYNVLQKLAYVIVIFGLLPVMVLSGLTMSPAATAAMPFLLDLFGGRQSARTIHFLATDLLVLFVLVHIVQVLITGAFNNMRAMITGRYAILPETGT
jgi:thiosulfate reductase cytochrome b subunit